MGDKADKSGVSERCVTCGELIEAPSRDELFEQYTDHQVEEHDKPRTVYHAKR